MRNIFIPKEANDYEKYLLTIEPSSICDAKCVFCNYRYGYREKTTIALDAFRRIAQSCFEAGYKNLNLTSVGGEFLTHPQAVSMLEIAKHIGYESIALHTNGILLYRHDIERLLNSGLGCLLISTPGFSPELYRDIFGVDKYPDFRKSILELLETHRKMNSKVAIRFCPRTYLSKREIHNSAFFIETISKYVNDVVVLEEPLTVFDSWNGLIKQEDLKKGMAIDVSPLKSIYPIKKVHPCAMLEQVNILSTGDVRLCNCRYDRFIGTADDSLFIDNLLNYASMREFLDVNGGKIRSIKKNFAEGRLPELCRKCSMYRPMK